MKRILTFVLAVLMIAGCACTFASCGAGSDFEKIQEKGEMVVGYTIYAPMNYYDANGDLEPDESGDFIGFDTELAKLVGEKLGVTIKFQKIEWNNKYLELSSGAIDCIWNGFTSNSKDDDGVARADKVDFTYAYLDNAQCVIVRADEVANYTGAASLQGKKAAAEKGSAGMSYAKSVTAEDKVVGVDAQTDAFLELSTGAVDFIVVDVLLADKTVGKGNYTNLVKASAISIDSEVYSIGCRKDSDLDEKINEALVELLNAGKIEELAAKYNVHVTETLMAKKTAK